jgi:hypothetical protein
MDSIFVSIAACKEKFLAQTVQSAISNAHSPELLYFGISNMVVDDEDFLSDPVFQLPNVNYVETKHKTPLGIGFGRMAASLMFDRQHKYMLQIDAHTIFEKNWDLMLKNYYTKLLSICDKPIISLSPQFWAENKELKPILFDNPDKIVDPYNFETESTNPTLNIAINNNSNNERHHGEFKNYAFIDGSHYEWKEDEDFVEHGLISAACVFADFNIVREVMHDPINTFDGDQINFSFRAGTRGYRMFSVKKSFLWTKTKFRDGKLISDYDWRLCPKSNIISYYSIYSKMFQTKIFSGEYTGYWGAQSSDSIKEYSDKIKINLSDYFKREDLDI